MAYEAMRYRDELPFVTIARLYCTNRSLPGPCRSTDLHYKHAM